MTTKFKFVNNITGWVIFAIAAFTYLSTMEATSSLWDCGEFLATAYRLEVAHAPGAPLFMIVGRIFSLFAASKEQIAVVINAMSALCSAFTVLFLFWTITHFARKIFAQTEEALAGANLIAVMGAGIVGALAYTFSDTFWFSAVEGEVYAMSSFFTALVFWAILKWEHNADHPHADRWLLLIFYLMGLSIGVHLLNLLTIPAIVMVYYFTRYTITLKGSIVAFLVGCTVLGFIQFGVIQYVPIMASWFELLFVNSFGLPYNSGAICFIVLLAALLGFLIIWAKKKEKYLLHLMGLSLSFILIGYSSYVTVLVRSQADVPIDMGNPDNVMALIPYLQRDQYGAQPVVFGPDFDSRVTDIKDGRAIYGAVPKDGKNHYELLDHKPEYEYDKKRFFPRIWSFNDPNHVSYYRNRLGLGPTESPTSADNVKFFLDYQVNWMFWRYFMWNYAGRQNDMQGQGEAHNGNWISGVKVVDKFLGKGDIDAMPEAYRDSKSRNQYYFLPFILGVVGLVYHFKKDKKGAGIVTMLFFFTGLAVQLYINNTPLQPRERDYQYIATYAYAIWIGIGVLMLTDLLRRKIKGTTPAPALIATAVCLCAVPILMAAQNWDDHDRSEKTIARDHALNLLNSCDSNAILITYADNDTYPLWYLQEIEGYRTDVRVINYNLLGTDWQNEQLSFKVNDAAAIPVIWEIGQYKGANLNYIPVVEDKRLPKDRFFNLEEIIHFFADGKNQLDTRGGGKTSFLPTKNLMIPLDKAALIRSGLLEAADTALLQSELRFVFNKGNATRADLSLMNILAGQVKTGWTRPIYLTEGTPNLGLDAYFHAEGTLRKFVPVNKPSLVPGLPPYTNLDENVKLFTETFTYGKANGSQVNYDEKNRLLFLVYRKNTAELALNLIAAGRKADAIKVLDTFMSKVSEQTLAYNIFLYDRSIIMILDAYFKAGALDKARKYSEKFMVNTQDEVKYFHSLPAASQAGMDASMVQSNLGMMNYLVSAAAQAGDSTTANKWMQQLQAMDAGLGGVLPMQ